MRVDDVNGGGFTDTLTRAVVWAIIGVIAGVLIVGGVALVVKTSDAAEQARKTTHNTNRVTRAVLDCTTPRGECFRRSKRATAKAVGNINRVVVVAAACAAQPGPQTVARVQTCVVRELARRDH